MLPFKSRRSPTIYVKPYRDMWMQGFEDWLEHVDQKVEEGGGRDAMAGSKYGVRWVERQDYLRSVRSDIRDGSFPFKDLGSDIEIRGGYAVSYTLVAMRPIETSGPSWRRASCSRSSSLARWSSRS